MVLVVVWVELQHVPAAMSHGFSISTAIQLFRLSDSSWPLWLSTTISLAVHSCHYFEVPDTIFYRFEFVLSPVLAC